MNEICRKIGNAGIICGGALIVSSIVAMPVVNRFNPYRNEEAVLRYNEIGTELNRMRENEKSRAYFRESIRGASDEFGSLENSESVRGYREWAGNAGKFGLGGAAVGGGIVALTMLGMGAYVVRIMYKDWKEKKRKKTEGTGN